MDNLLDTHALLWYIEGNKSLSANAKTAMENKTVVNYVSMVSVWEVSIKISTGKLMLNTAFSSLAYYISYNGFKFIPLTFQDTVTVLSLPFHHKDPFDRMLIAQATNNNLQIVTKDGMFSNYGVSLIW